MKRPLQVKLLELESELRIKTMILELCENSHLTLKYQLGNVFHPPVVDPVVRHLLAFDFCVFFFFSFAKCPTLGVSKTCDSNEFRSLNCENVEKALN